MKAELHSVTANDYEPLARALAASGLGDCDGRWWIARMRHWWDANPAMAKDGVRGWCLRDGDAIVGFQGSIPRWVSIDGRRGTSVNSTTTWVAPPYRALSLQLLVRWIAQPACAHFNTTADDTMARLLAGLKFRPFPRLDPGQRVLLLRPAAAAAALARRRDLRMTARAAEALGTLVDPPAAEALFRLRAACWPKAPELQARVVARADQGFEALWDRTSPTLGLTADRSAASLNWFLDGDSACARVLIGVYQDDALRAFGLFVRLGDPLLPTLQCIDWFPELVDHGVARALLACVSRRAVRGGIAVVKVPSWTEAQAGVLASLGLRAYPAGDGRYLRTSPGTPDGYLTHSHGDYAL